MIHVHSHVENAPTTEAQEANPRTEAGFYEENIRTDSDGITINISESKNNQKAMCNKLLSSDRKVRFYTGLPTRVVFDLLF